MDHDVPRDYRHKGLYRWRGVITKREREREREKAKKRGKKRGRERDNNKGRSSRNNGHQL